jgi:hypothetical protein
MSDHIQVAIGDGVERAWIERDAGHVPVLARPGRRGKLGQSGRNGAFHGLGH